MLGHDLSRPWRLALGAAAVVLLLGLYSFLSYQRRQVNPNDRTIPSFGQMLEGVKRVVAVDVREERRPMVHDAQATFGRLFFGLAVAVSASVVLGLMMGVWAPAEAFFLPSLSFLAKIAPTAMLAVFFVLVGVRTQMYVAMITFGTLPTLAQSVYAAVRKDVPEELVSKAFTLGASRLEVVWNVIFAHILPRMIDAVRLQVGPAMVLLVAAEWMVAGEGFGYRLRLYYQKTDMTVVYAYLMVLGVAGYLIDWALTRLRQRLCPWFGD